MTRSSTSAGRTRRRTRSGWARRCRPRRSGSTRRAAASTGRPTPGARSRSRTAARWPTTWSGEFPWQNLARDGYRGTSPVGTFPPNGFGLFDVTGNVWEWTAGLWSDGEGGACCGPDGTAERFERRVIKGGSHLCAPELLPALPALGAAGRDGRHEHIAHRVPLHPPDPGRLRPVGERPAGGPCRAGDRGARGRRARSRRATSRRRPSAGCGRTIFWLAITGVSLYLVAPSVIEVARVLRGPRADRAGLARGDGRRPGRGARLPVGAPAPGDPRPRAGSRS